MSLTPNDAPARDGGPQGHLAGSTTDLAADAPRSRVDRILQWVPRILASKPHVVFLMGLGIYLIVLPLAGLTVTAKAELIGGNYTNVTSDIGACIAAGGTLHLVRQASRRRKIEEERLVLARQTHRLLHYVYASAARELGHAGPDAGPAPGMPPPGSAAGPGPGTAGT
jgi:hypothetical protein